MFIVYFYTITKISIILENAMKPVKKNFFCTFAIELTLDYHDISKLYFGLS